MSLRLQRRRPWPQAFGALAILLAVSATDWANAAECAPDRYKIAIDVGHYDAAPGAISARGVPERTFNLALASRIKERLTAAGFSGGFLIAESGEKISLKARVQIANDRQADAFLSVHHDSAQERFLSPWAYGGRKLRYTDDISGFSLFVSGENIVFPEGQRLATRIGMEMIAAGYTPTLHHAAPIPGENRELLDAELGVYRWDRLGVVRTTLMPAVLLEAGVILNRADEAALSQPETQTHIADAVVRGLRAFLCPAADQ